MITNLMGLRASFDSRLANVAAMGVVAGLGVLAHHLYLRARGLGAMGIAGGVLIYLLASTAGARLAAVLDPAEVEGVAILRRGVVGGLLQWAVMAVALWTAERAAPAPAPPARDV